MIYGSVCSGVAPQTKRCSQCREVKPLDDFHRQRSGPQGRHSWCKACYKAHDYPVRPNPAARKRQNIKSRYGLTVEEVNTIVQKQHGKCPICQRDLTEALRPCIDHDHRTNKVRGVLCHRCNVGIAFMDDLVLSDRARNYLGRVD